MGYIGMNEIRDTMIISKFSDLKKNHQWFFLWTTHLLEYLLLFDLIYVGCILVFRSYDLIPTNIDNARYLLSAMVQAQATVITLVITLTLIAIQMATGSYTPRVVDVMKKNPDMWFLLLIYLTAITYGFIILKQVEDGANLTVASVLALGIYTFATLFLYMINTIRMLRPDEIVKMLVGEINAGNIHKKEGADDVMQPIFDVVHASINRFDVTTTRTGLNKLSDRIHELLPAFEGEAKSGIEITGHFCSHIQRICLILLRNEDEDALGMVITRLRSDAVRLIEERHEESTFPVISVLKFIGVLATDKGLEETTIKAVWILEEVGEHAADKGFENVICAAAWALHDVGKHAADKGLERTMRDVAGALKCMVKTATDKDLDLARLDSLRVLKRVGEYEADKGLEDATKEVTWALRELGEHAAKKSLEDATGVTAIALQGVGMHAADKGLEDATRVAVGALQDMGIPAAGKGFEDATGKVAWALREVGELAADKGLEDATGRVAGALRELGKHAAKKGLRDATTKAAHALGSVGKHAADHNLEGALKIVINSLFAISCTTVGNAVAVTSFAELWMKNEEVISTIAKDIKTTMQPDEIVRFDDFMNRAAQELKK